MARSLLDPRRPHLAVRLFVLLGAGLLFADMALHDPLGGIKGWGWIYFTILIAVGVSPLLALPFLVACLTLVIGSRLWHAAKPGQAHPEGALTDVQMAVILSVCALWFLVVLVIQLVRITREEEQEAQRSEPSSEE